MTQSIQKAETLADREAALPPGKSWPPHMLGDEPLRVRMRATYARIANAVAGDRELAAEKVAALEWCRAHGNPHLAVRQILQEGSPA